MILLLVCTFHSEQPEFQSCFICLVAIWLSDLEQFIQLLWGLEAALDPLISGLWKWAEHCWRKITQSTNWNLYKFCLQDHLDPWGCLIMYHLASSRSLFQWLFQTSNLLKLLNFPLTASYPCQLIRRQAGNEKCKNSPTVTSNIDILCVFNLSHIWK